MPLSAHRSAALAARSAQAPAARVALLAQSVVVAVMPVPLALAAVASAALAAVAWLQVSGAVGPQVVLVCTAADAADTLFHARLT